MELTTKQETVVTITLSEAEAGALERILGGLNESIVDKMPSTKEDDFYFSGDLYDHLTSL